MKRGSTKFWLCVSLSLAAAVTSVPLGARTPPGAAGQSAARRNNELLLAGLRPGRDNLTIAEKRFKTRLPAAEPNSTAREWRDDCSGRSIRVELNAKSVIQSVTLTTLGKQEGACSDRRPDFLDPRNWLTGLGLRMGDSQDRVAGLYGEPNSSGPASKNGQELSLMYYQFDWAGSDVPQVMEVLCARDTGRVVEITLAFPSL